MATVVLGAGIAGLAAAHVLTSRGEDVLVLEATDRVGGVVRSEWIDGVLVESAAQSLRGATWPTLRALGLEDRIVPSSPAAKNRYLLHHGRLVALPASLLGLLTTPLLSPRGRWRALAEPFVPRGLAPSATVFDLLARRIGPEAADTFGTPFVGGVFGGDPHQVEADSALPRLARQARAGSLALAAAREPRPAGAPAGPFSFVHGIEELPRAFARVLGDRVRLGAAARAVRRSGAGWRIDTDLGRFDAERLVIALPAHVAAGLIDVPVPGHAPIAAVLLAWRGVAPPDGFGWLAHPRETTDALGAIHQSTVFPAHAPDRTAIRVMLGGARAPALPALSDDALIAHAQRVVGAVYGIDAAPDLAVVRRALPGIPQYPPGFAAKVAAVRDVRLVGWGWTGPGIPDALAAAAALG